MKLIGVGFLSILFFGIYLFQGDKDLSFREYQYRKPAQSKNKNRPESKPPETSVVGAKKIGRPSLKPLDSRKISAQVFEQAHHDQEVNDIVLAGKEYFLSEDMFAVAKRDWDENDPAIITEYLGHYIVSGVGPVGVAQPVLINKVTSNYAIVTKVLKVKYHQGEGEISFSSPAKLVESYSHINVYLYQFDTLDDLSSGYEEASAYTGIKRATIEILEGARIGQ